MLLTAAAYVLMQELRLRARGTRCARAQVWMLLERLLKLGARVLVSMRNVVVHLPAAFPFLATTNQSVTRQAESDSSSLWCGVQART